LARKFRLKIRSKKRKAKKRKGVEPVPKGFHSVTPYLAVNGAAQALEWYKKAFGAKELMRHEGPGGKLIHASMKIGDSIVMLSDTFEGGHKDPLALGGSPTTLHIYSKNVDVFWQRAVEAGAKVEMQLDNMFWGERYGQLSDPYGHSWSVAMRISMSPEEMKRKQEEAMRMFEQSEHP
jgi:uncharacterized glyoxalase superfamily protein PhnB